MLIETSLVTVYAYDVARSYSDHHAAARKGYMYVIIHMYTIHLQFEEDNLMFDKISIKAPQDIRV